uniref:MARVEL domain-containing protein n=1 Tax=Macrostomum lignano TaxID=282301 RepID=A0A1I8JES2_9PLAT
HPTEVDEVTADGHEDDNVNVCRRPAGCSGARSPGAVTVNARMRPPPRLLTPAGLLICLVAFCLVLLSLANVVLIPLMYSNATERYPMRLDYHNLYGYGIWLAFLLVGCGTLALRTAHDGAFYVVSWVAGLACIGVVIARIVYYADKGYSDIATGLPHKLMQFWVQIACDSCALASLLLICPSLLFYLGTASKYWAAMATGDQPLQPDEEDAVVTTINTDEADLNIDEERRNGEAANGVGRSRVSVWNA